MQIYTVWTNKRVGVGEKCLMRDNGDYIGLETGTVFPAGEHYHSEQFKGRIVGVDEKNLTGMYHLDEEWSDKSEENAHSFKERFLGCEVTLERAHSADGLQIYRCMELGEYFSEKEVEVLGGLEEACNSLGER